MAPRTPPVPATPRTPAIITDAPFDSALSQRYLVYALSTITARSLPDLRDGLKPVHRRLLWAMRQMRLDPAQPYKKSARVVGDVIGKYHPHGDTAVYDAMVRLAQPFSLRYPLVDGQGNYGNIDGDAAAAYRYTETRLTRTAVDLMAGLDDGTVDFRPTYNGEETEPEVMPGLFPNLLANGSSGIAVGMATSIPPHNAAEIIDAAMLLIDRPDAAIADVMALVRGPDLPTGGLIVDSAVAIAAAYDTGRGSFRVRARFGPAPTDDAPGDAADDAGVERLPGGLWQLVVTEIPYGVAKGKLIEQIAQLIADKKLPILEDVRDESDEAVRIVMVPRSRNVDPAVLRDGLYRLTDLETRLSLNMNVLGADRTPRVMGLVPVLRAWLDHQIIVLVRRATTRIGRIDDRLELVAGYILAFLNLDRVIQIIRAEDEPKPVMMAEFDLTDRQAEAILNMRLRALRRLEEMALRREQAQLEKERADLARLIDDPASQRRQLKKELGAMRAAYGPDTPLGRRRTTIAEAAPLRDIPLSAMIDREPVTVILSTRGWIRAQRGHLAPGTEGELKYKDGDAGQHIVRAQTTDRLVLVTDDGRAFTLGADKLPGGRGFGEPVRSMLDIANDARVVAVVPVPLGLAPAAPPITPANDDAASSSAALPAVPTGPAMLLAATTGHGFLVALADAVAETRKGRQLMNLKGTARLAVARVLTPGDDMVAVVGDNRKLAVFPLGEVPRMTRGQGVALQRYRDGGLSDAITFRMADGLAWPMGGGTGRTRTEPDMGPWRTARGTAGRMPPVGFPRSNRFSG